MLVITDSLLVSKYLSSNYSDLLNEHLENFNHNKEAPLMGAFNTIYNVVTNCGNKEFNPSRPNPGQREKMPS